MFVYPSIDNGRDKIVPETYTKTMFQSFLLASNPATEFKFGNVWID